MPCKNKQTQTTRTANKEGHLITTHTSKRVCANDMADIAETHPHPHAADDARELEKKEIYTLLGPNEELVFPEHLNQNAEKVWVVVRNTQTGEKTLKAVPRWAVDKVPSQKELQMHMQPEIDLREAFARFLTGPETNNDQS